MAEKLFLKTWELELDEADERRIWAYRRAAWMVDELSISLERLYNEEGLEGLKTLPGLGERIAAQVAGYLETWRQRREKKR